MSPWWFALTALLSLALSGTFAAAQVCEPGMPQRVCAPTTCIPEGHAVSTQTCPCCPGLTPQRSSGCKCLPGAGATPTTTVPPGTSTSTTTQPGASTTTTTLPLNSPYPVRWGPSDVAVNLRSSQEIKWSPRDGHFLNQYERGTRVLYMHGVVMPAALRAFRDIPRCRGQLSYAAGVYTTINKFLIRYNFRDPGEPYGWGPNYIWDLPQNVFRRLKGCAPRASLSPLLDAVLYPTHPPAKHQQARTELEHVGEYDPQRPTPPLTPQQCAALEAVRVKHTNVAGLTALARDPWEADMFDMVFALDIDVIPGDDYCTPARAQRMTDATNRNVAAWIAAFHCDTGAPPDRVAVALHMWDHFRSHAIRAACIEGMLIVDPVDDTGFYPRCVPGPLFDIHYCPDKQE